MEATLSQGNQQVRTNFSIMMLLQEIIIRSVSCGLLLISDVMTLFPVAKQAPDHRSWTGIKEYDDIVNRIFR